MALYLAIGRAPQLRLCLIEEPTDFYSDRDADQLLHSFSRTSAMTKPELSGAAPTREGKLSGALDSSGAPLSIYGDGALD